MSVARCLRPHDVCGDESVGHAAAVTVAKLAVEVVAPAGQDTRLAQRAGVLIAGVDLHGVSESRDLARGGSIHGGTVAELASDVPAPAGDLAGATECAGVRVAGHESRSRKPANKDRNVPTQVGPITELAIRVVAPTRDASWSVPRSAQV